MGHITDNVKPIPDHWAPEEKQGAQGDGEPDSRTKTQDAQQTNAQNLGIQGSMSDCEKNPENWLIEMPALALKL